MPYKGKGKQRNSGVYGGVDDNAHLSDRAGSSRVRKTANAQSGPEFHKAGKSKPGGGTLNSKPVSQPRYGGMGKGKGY